MLEPSYRVYILASGRNGALYAGLTSNLIRRIQQHKRDDAPGFTSKYKVTIPADRVRPWVPDTLRVPG